MAFAKRCGCLRRQNTYRFELLFSHDLFQALLGYPLVGSVKWNVRELPPPIEAVSCAIAPGDVRFAVLDALGTEI